MPQTIDTTIIFNSFWLAFKPFLPLYGGMIVLAIVFKSLEIYLSDRAGRYTLRKYRIEFFTALSAVAGYIVTYAFFSQPGIAFALSAGITLTATMYIVYAKTTDKDFYFLQLNKPADRNDWIGDGTFQYERVHDAFSVINSDAGFIFSKTLTWSDYTYDFEFKILNTCLGVVLRATNLSNLAMLQIVPKGIRPHIRINGGWRAWEIQETNLAFSRPINLDKWYRVKIECDKSAIRIRIKEIGKEGDDAILIDREWSLPKGPVTLSYESEKNIGLIAEAAIKSIPYPVNLEYGTVGFRNNDVEKALVRDVLIEKL